MFGSGKALSPPEASGGSDALRSKPAEAPEMLVQLDKAKEAQFLEILAQSEKGASSTKASPKLAAVAKPAPRASLLPSGAPKMELENHQKPSSSSVAAGGRDLWKKSMPTTDHQSRQQQSGSPSKSNTFRGGSGGETEVKEEERRKSTVASAVSILLKKDSTTPSTVGNRMKTVKEWECLLLVLVGKMGILYICLDWMASVKGRKSHSRWTI